MNEFKYQITQLVFLLLLGFGAYWAFTNLDSGVSYERENSITVADEEIGDPVDDIVAPPVSIDNENNTVNEDTDNEDTLPDSDETESNEDLIERLNALAESDTMLDSGSSGEAVRTVQEFLALYHDEEITIDGDFGPGTKGLVREFQQEELNGGDGRVGPNTLTGMVEYLEN